MIEISYQVFDEESRLPVSACTDSCVRELAELDNKSLSEVFNDMKKIVKEVGVKYMVPGGTKDIIVVLKPSMSACRPTYFENYKNAVEYIKGLS